MVKELAISSITGEPKDDIDKYLIYTIIPIVLDNSTMALIKVWGQTNFENETADEQYLRIIIDVIKSLLKANHHRRSYLKYEKEIEVEILEKNKNITEGIDLIEERPDLISEVDSFLIQIKSALDSLAKSLNPIFGCKFQNWGKGTVQGKKGKKSGGRIINALNNTPVSIRNRIKDLVEFIEDNIDYISAIVWLRDSPTHHGGIKVIRGFVYKFNEKKIILPVIMLKDGKEMLLPKFLNLTIKNIIDFVENIIVISLSNLTPGLFLAKISESEYQWRIKNKS